ncbi:hypothetical protein ACMHYB_60410 [Sorangium sp. So ce1128]
MTRERPSGPRAGPTRRNLFDELRLKKFKWSGREGDVKFLGRMFNLNALPSTDNRHKTVEARCGWTSARSAAHPHPPVPR